MPTSATHTMRHSVPGPCKNLQFLPMTSSLLYPGVRCSNRTGDAVISVTGDAVISVTVYCVGTVGAERAHCGWNCSACTAAHLLPHYTTAHQCSSALLSVPCKHHAQYLLAHRMRRRRSCGCNEMRQNGCQHDCHGFITTVHEGSITADCATVLRAACCLYSLCAVIQSILSNGAAFCRNFDAVHAECGSTLVGCMQCC